MGLVLKGSFRDLLPAALQVPAKFWLNRMRGQLDSELKLLPYLVEKGDKVVDIGGNRGIYAYALWQLGATLAVFEPNPVCASVLAGWAAGKETVTVYPLALSDHAGTSNLHVPVDGAGVEHDASASLEHADCERGHNLPVELRTLDSFGFQNIALVKIDVEGHENSVLKGARATVRASPALAVLAEIEQRHCRFDIQDTFDFLGEEGFEGFFLRANLLRPLSEFVLERDQALGNLHRTGSVYVNNFLFLRRERIAAGAYQRFFESWGRV
jgi:FkbM family methyltransferase